MSAQDIPSLTAHELVTVTVDGRNLGVFDNLSGGGSTAESSKYRPGGRVDNVPVGGLPDVDSITVSRAFIRSRDHNLIRWLRTRRGRGQSVVSRQPLDPEMNPWGKPDVHRGVLVGVTPSEYDANSSDPKTFELTFEVGSRVG